MLKEAQYHMTNSINKPKTLIDRNQHRHLPFSFQIHNQNQDQRILNLRMPVTGSAGVSGFAFATSIKWRIGTSERGMILVFLINL